MSTQPPIYSGAPIPPAARLAIAAASFNTELVDELLAGCQRRLAALGIAPARLEIHRVPGAFGLPLAAQALARTRHFAAIICLGAVVRGDTPHFDYVAGECARGIAAVSLAHHIPVIFGVLTTNTRQQALDRLGGPHGHAGELAAEAALEMISLMAKLQPIPIARPPTSG